MKITCLLVIMSCLAFAGRLGIGIAGGSQYIQDYKTLEPAQMNELFYGAQFSLQAEALPNVLLVPAVSFMNNPSISSSAAGFGVGITIQPRLGNFPIVPHFGGEGTLLLYNDMNVTDAMRQGNFETYIETSTPRLVGSGYAGLSLFLGRSISLDCSYRYHSFSRVFAVEMFWAGLNYYVNW